jgi:hypothetical protein
VTDVTTANPVEEKHHEHERNRSGENYNGGTWFPAGDKPADGRQETIVGLRMARLGLVRIRDGLSETLRNLERESWKTVFLGNRMNSVVL